LADIKHNIKSVYGIYLIKNIKSDNKSKNGAPKKPTCKNPEDIFSNNNICNLL
jgi:hypothetical protein